MDITQYAIPAIMALCWCVGFIVKKWINDVDNKWIPTICGVLGIVFNIMMNNWTVTLEIVLGGIASGLAATGINEAVTKLTKTKAAESK